MKFFPVNHRTVVSSMKKEKLLKDLENLTTKNIFTRDKSSRFTGKVTKNGFRLSVIPTGRMGKYRPLIVGRVKEEDHQTIITYHFEPKFIDRCIYFFFVLGCTFIYAIPGEYGDMLLLFIISSVIFGGVFFLMHMFSTNTPDEIFRTVVRGKIVRE